MSDNDLENAIRETVDAAKNLQARETALKDAVASGDSESIVKAARAFFGEEHVSA